MVNFKAFIKLLIASDVSIVEKASQNILAFIHFSMIQGIQRNPDSMSIQDEQLQFFFAAFKLDKLTISKSLLKSIYWALSLPTSKFPLLTTFRPAQDEFGE